MDLVHVIVVLIVIGIVLWLIETYIPMDPTIRTIIRVVVIIALCLWLLSVAGLLSGGPYLRVPR